MRIQLAPSLLLAALVVSPNLLAQKPEEELIEFGCDRLASMGKINQRTSGGMVTETVKLTQPVRPSFREQDRLTRPLPQSAFPIFSTSK